MVRRLNGIRGIGYRVAIVVSRDVDFGISRMYEAYTGELPNDIQVHRDVEEALRWVSPEAS